jgi:hypothetical protein
VLFDSRTNLEEGGGLSNELWLKFITDPVSDDGLLECMSVLEEARERRRVDLSQRREKSGGGEGIVDLSTEEGEVLMDDFATAESLR